MFMYSQISYAENLMSKMMILGSKTFWECLGYEELVSLWKRPHIGSLFFLPCEDTEFSTL